MKVLFSIMSILALSACAAPSQKAVDAAPVLASGQPVKTAFGATVTGRDWNAPPSESGGSAGNGDGKSK